MDITRIDTYDDERFSQKVLNQHGAYLISGDPYEIEIINTTEAVVRGNDSGVYPDLIEYFRFHAPHIIRFSDEYGKQIVSYPSPEIIDVEIDKIQPSQFFIDEEKLDAIRSFANDREDIIVQVLPWNDRFICKGGHK